MLPFYLDPRTGQISPSRWRWETHQDTPRIVADPRQPYFYVSHQTNFWENIYNYEDQPGVGITALEAATGRPVWQHRILPGDPRGYFLEQPDLLAVGESLYTVTTCPMIGTPPPGKTAPAKLEYFVYRLRSSDGQPQWQTRTTGWDRLLGVTSDTVLLGRHQGQKQWTEEKRPVVWALGRETGRPRWERKNVDLLQVAEPLAYLHTRPGDILAVGLRDGQEQYRYTAR